MFGPPGAAATAMSLLGGSVLGSGDASTRLLNGWLAWPVSLLKPYFAVTTQFVGQRCGALVFPWRRAVWQRMQLAVGPDVVGMPGAVPIYSAVSSSLVGAGNPYAAYGPSEPGGLMAATNADDEGSTGSVPVLFALPRDDANAPDLYVPVMAFVSYVLLVGIIYGLDGRFHPELLGATASWALVLGLLQSAGIKLATYLLSFGAELPLLDIMAYAGYQFVPLFLVAAVSLLLPSSLLRAWPLFFSPSFILFLYLALAYATFLLRVLRHAVLPESPNLYSPLRRKKIHLLLLLVLVHVLCSSLLIVTPAFPSSSSSPPLSSSSSGPPPPPIL